MNWYRKSQKVSETEGTLEFTFSFDEWLKHEEAYSMSPTNATVERMKTIDGLTVSIHYHAMLDMSGNGTDEITFDRPETMNSFLFYPMQGLIRKKINEELHQSEDVQSMKDEHFGKRLEHNFWYTFDRNLPPNPANWSDQDAGSTLTSMHGKKFLVHFLADYLPQGVYNIRPFRPEGIPGWVWEGIVKDVKEKCWPHATEKLDRIRQQDDPTEAILDWMERQGQ